jgi:hypothetical protein
MGSAIETGNETTSGELPYAVAESVRGLSVLEGRALVTVALEGPQPLDELAERLGAPLAAIGAVARALVARGTAVRVPRGRGEGPPMLVASTGGMAIVRDARRRRSTPRPLA